MASMTLRLEEQDHDLLRMLSIVTRKSANQIVVDLLRAEFDREMPGKRTAMSKAGSSAQGLREALGLAAVPTDDLADARLDTALARIDGDAQSFYADHGRQAA